MISKTPSIFPEKQSKQTNTQTKTGVIVVKDATILYLPVSSCWGKWLDTSPSALHIQPNYRDRCPVFRSKFVYHLCVTNEKSQNKADTRCESSQQSQRGRQSGRKKTTEERFSSFLNSVHSFQVLH